MVIHWTKPTESGLADRLTDVLQMATYARARKAQLYMEWPRFPARSIDVEHRRTDILLDNVRKFINFPPEVMFNRPAHIDRTFDLYIGGATANSDFHHGHLKDVCTWEEFNEIFASVAKDFTFCDEINNFLKTLPDKFMALHVRRGDKVRVDNGVEKQDGTYIYSHELDWLNGLTYKALDYYLSLGYDRFFVCSDEDNKKAMFVDYLISKGKSIITIPDLPKWQSTYYDLATMTRSDFNLTSQRYSSFSRFPSMIGIGKFQTVANFQ